VDLAEAARSTEAAVAAACTAAAEVVAASRWEAGQRERRVAIWAAAAARIDCTRRRLLQGWRTGHGIGQGPAAGWNPDP
jgi:hypothetical protein